MTTGTAVAVFGVQVAVGVGVGTAWEDTRVMRAKEKTVENNIRLFCFGVSGERVQYKFTFK